MFLLENIIFKYFGRYEKVTDTYKDGNDKGINERFQETLAAEYDTEVAPLVDNLYDNTIDPRTLLTKFLNGMELMLGGIFTFYSTEQYRRKMIGFFNPYYERKGTITQIIVQLKMLGIETVVVEEIAITTGFDSDLTFDDNERTFDLSESCCFKYNLIMTGGLTLTADIIQAMTRIIEFNEPINAELKLATYNGAEVVLNQIIVKIEEGVLYYDNTNDPGIILQLNMGVLEADGISRDLYFVQDGILYFIVAV